MGFKKRNHDLILFIKACLLVEVKNIQYEGQKEIAEIASKLSSKLSLDEKIKLFETHKKLNADWVTGITDAEGNFAFQFTFLSLKIKKQKRLFLDLL